MKWTLAGNGNEIEGKMESDGGDQMESHEVNQELKNKQKKKTAVLIYVCAWRAQAQSMEKRKKCAIPVRTKSHSS